MRTRALGRSRLEASVIGLGTWAIGGWPWGGTDEKESIDAIRTSIDEGISLIDTAPAYGLGLAEELVGKAIAGRRNRVILATKCGLVWDTDKGTVRFQEMGKEVRGHLGPDSVRCEVDQSLTRLRTDYIDLLQTHWQDPTTLIEDTMGALLDLKHQGKIRAIGVSNVTVKQLKEYLAVGPVDADQERYSMLDRILEEDIAPFCVRHGISILAYSPLAKGLLTGKIGPDREFPPTDLRHDDPQFSPENRRAVMEMLDQFKSVAEKHGVTFSQLAIAWTIAQPGITHALVGARNTQQSVENARAGDVILDDEDMYLVNHALAQYSMVSQNP